jgi:MFS family permease
MLLQGICHLLWFLTGGQTAYFIVPVAQILSGAALSGINIAVFNLQYSSAPESNRTVYLGFSSAVGGLFGFFGTLAGSFLLGVFNKTGGLSGFFGMDGIRIVLLISSLAILICFLVFRRHLYNSGR